METMDVKVARLQEKVNTLQDGVTDIRTDQKTQNAKLDRLLEFHNQRKGAQALLKAIAASGFLGWLWEHFHK